MAKASYRVAIIGTGRMGGLMEDETPLTNRFDKPYAHFSAYQAIEQTEVVAVANRGADRMAHFARRFGVDNTYLDYRQMIEKERPDIVSVTTPSFARAEPIIFAAENGVRGIYSEKGLCASLEEADRIADACRRNNVAFNWGAMRRHHDGYKRLRDAIARGDIGQPLFATLYQLTDLIKHHPHTIDAVQMLLGDPAPVWVEGRLVEKGEPLDPGDTRGGPRDGKTLQHPSAAAPARLRPGRPPLRPASRPGDRRPVRRLLPHRLRQRRGGPVRAETGRLRGRGARYRGMRLRVGQRRRPSRPPGRGRLRVPRDRDPPHGRESDGHDHTQHHPRARDRRPHRRQHRRDDAGGRGAVRHSPLALGGRRPRRRCRSPTGACTSPAASSARCCVQASVVLVACGRSIQPGTCLGLLGIDRDRHPAKVLMDRAAGGGGGQMSSGISGPRFLALAASAALIAARRMSR